MATLNKLRIAGWKSIKDATLELGQINVLIGPNGAGKSNLVSFFKLLHGFVTGNGQGFVERSGGADAVLHYGQKTTPQLEAELEYRAATNTARYVLRMAATAADRLVSDIQEIQPRTESWSVGAANMALIELMKSCRVFHFHDTSESSAIRKSTCYIEDNQHLRPDAGNLAAMLYLYQKRYEAVYRRIVSTLRLIVPHFGDFVLEPQRLNPNNIRLNWGQTGSDYLFGPHQLSDGSLRAMALATLLLQPEADVPSLIVLDEPELGLHPYAIALVAGMVRSASVRSQIVLATQSPAFINHFEPEEIIVVESHQGASQFKRLNAAELQDWLEDYSLGELWEKNVLGGGPMA